MLIDLKAEFKAGGQFDLAKIFTSGAELNVTAPVRGPDIDAQSTELEGMYSESGSG